MRVKIVIPVADSKRRYRLGEVVDVPEEQAKVWVSLGYVEPQTRAARRAVKRATKKATANKAASTPPKNNTRTKRGG